MDETEYVELVRNWRFNKAKGVQVKYVNPDLPNSNFIDTNKAVSKPVEVDLFKRAQLQPFKGEAKCSNFGSFIWGVPKQPWFGEDNARTLQSMKEIRRWVACTHREFPVCHHTQRSVDILFKGLREDGGDGQYTGAMFYCYHCWGQP